MWRWLETIPQIIEAAAKSQTGVLALVVIVLGVIGVIFFRREPLLYKVRIYVFMFVGFGLFLVSAYRVELPPPITKTDNPATQPENTSDEANALVTLGNHERTLGRKDEARTAFTEARSIYKANNNRLARPTYSWAWVNLSASSIATTRPAKPLSRRAQSTE